MKKLAQSVKSMEGTVQTNPSSTKAVALSQQKRRQELQFKRDKEKTEQKEAAARAAKQNKLKDEVQGALKAKFKESAKQVVARESKEKKEHLLHEEKKNKAVLKAAVEKGRSRPMLHERGADFDKERSNLAFLKATKKMVDILKSQGEAPGIYLTREQKQALEEDQIATDLMRRVRGDKAGFKSTL